MDPVIDPFDVVVPVSEITTAIEAAQARIEDEEIPRSTALDRVDEPVWMRFHDYGAVVRFDPPGLEDGEDWLEESHAKLLSMMSAASTAVIEALESMTVSGKPGEELAGDPRMFSMLATGGHGFRLFEVDFTRHILPDLATMYRRSLEVSQLVLLRKPGPSAARYLSRIPKAYVFGLDAEAVILCRSSIEAALRDVFHEHREPWDGTMGERLERAELLGWLTQEGRIKARGLWEDGSRVVHGAPEVVYVLPAISTAVHVVSELIDD